MNEENNRQISGILRPVNSAILNHDCSANSHLIKCDQTTDTLKCSICLKEWEVECSFDEDYD